MASRPKSQSSSRMRTEQDSLGSKLLPADVYYGIQTLRAIENFQISGLRSRPAFIRAIARIKRAAAEANLRLGLLRPTMARAIIAASQEMIDGRHDDQFRVDVYQAGAGTSFNMNANEVIANRALELLKKRRGDYEAVNPNDHVNMAQSTNDIIPTSIRLASLDLLQSLDRSLEMLERACLTKGREFRRVVKSARTHLQDAVPIMLGRDFQAYGRMVGESRRRLRQVAQALCELNIGGTAAGTGLNAHPRYQQLVVQRLRALTGQPLRPAQDLVAIMQSMADFADLSGALNTLAVDLTKIANDLRLLASGPRTGWFEINLPALQPGSSIMPGKVNPVMPEMLNMVCYQVMGNHLTVTMAAQAGQLELNVMMPLIAHNLIFSLEILTHATNALATKCIGGITANVKRCRDYAEKSVSIATVLNPLIGYQKTAKLVQEAIARDVSFLDLALQHRIADPKRLRQMLDPARLAEPHAGRRAR